MVEEPQHADVHPAARREKIARFRPPLQPLPDSFRFQRQALYNRLRPSHEPLDVRVRKLHLCEGPAMQAPAQAGAGREPRARAGTAPEKKPDAAQRRG